MGCSVYSACARTEKYTLPVTSSKPHSTFSQWVTQNSQALWRNHHFLRENGSNTMTSPGGSSRGVQVVVSGNNAVHSCTLLCDMFRCLIISGHCVNKRRVGINFHMSKTKEGVLKCAAPEGAVGCLVSSVSPEYKLHCTSSAARWISLAAYQPSCMIKVWRVEFFFAAYHPPRRPFRQR
jgi:hypothetical protein